MDNEFKEDRIKDRRASSEATRIPSQDIIRGEISRREFPGTTIPEAGTRFKEEGQRFREEGIFMIKEEGEMHRLDMLESEVKRREDSQAGGIINEPEAS